MYECIYVCVCMYVCVLMYDYGYVCVYICKYVCVCVYSLLNKLIKNKQKCFFLL